MPSVHSSLKIEANWDGTPDKVLAARLLARPTVHFTWHWVKFEVFEQNCLLAMCASSLKFIETNWDGTPDKVLAARPPAR